MIQEPYVTSRTHNLKASQLDDVGCRYFYFSAICKAIKDYFHLVKGGFIKDFKSTRYLETWAKEEKLRMVRACLDTNMTAAQRKRCMRSISYMKMYAYDDHYSSEEQIESLCKYFISDLYRIQCDYCGYYARLSRIDELLKKSESEFSGMLKKADESYKKIINRQYK